MLNSDETIPFDFIGRFEHLNSDLVKSSSEFKYFKDKTWYLSEI